MVISSYKWLICSWLWFRSYGFLLILLCHVFLSDLLVERAPWWTLYILFCNDDSSLFQSWWRDNFPNWRSTQYSTQCIFNEYVRSYSRRVCQEAFKQFKVLAQYLSLNPLFLMNFEFQKRLFLIRMVSYGRRSSKGCACYLEWFYFSWLKKIWRGHMQTILFWRQLQLSFQSLCEFIW